MKTPLLIPFVPSLSIVLASSKVLKMPRLTSLHGIAVLICAFTAGWVIVIISSAAGLNVFGLTLDFSKAGVFGDSFGGISAFMAASAAYFTYSPCDWSVGRACGSGYQTENEAGLIKSVMLNRHYSDLWS